MGTTLKEGQIEGRNAVLEALRAGTEIDKIFLADGNKTLGAIAAEAKKRRIPLQYADRRKIESMAETPVHQGVIALCAAVEYAQVEDLLALAAERGEPPLLVVLDEVSDPHNLGAVIRTASAAGAHGVIIPKRRSVGVNATVMKVSAGTAAYTKVAKVTNIAATLEELKQAGVWTAGADMRGSEVYTKADFKGPLAIVMGSEGKGISRLVRERCDFLVQIPMAGQAESLNVSVAAGILIYEAVRQRGEG